MLSPWFLLQFPPVAYHSGIFKKRFGYFWTGAPDGTRWRKSIYMKRRKKKEKRKKTINHHGYSPFSWGGLVSTRVFCCPRLRALQTTKRDPADDCNNESLVRRACCRRTLHRKSAIVPPPAVESNCGLSITFFSSSSFPPVLSVCLSCVSLYPVFFFFYVFAFLSSILVSRSGDGHKEFSLFSSSLFSFFDCERFLARQGFATLPSARSI